MTLPATVNPSFVAPILDLLVDPIIWVSPVYDLNNIIADFEIGYANRAANQTVNHPKGSLLGLRILRDGVPSHQSAQGNFNHFLEVFRSGGTLEYRFFAHHSNRMMETIRRVYEGGVLSTVQDRSKQREAERKEQETRRTLQSVFESSPIGISVYRAQRNEHGVITDFILQQYNERVNELTGITVTERSNLTLRKVLQWVGADDLFPRYITVVEQGTPFTGEQYLEMTGKWVSTSVVKLDDGILVMLTEITAQKEWQHSLQQESLFSSSILNASLNGIYVLEAIRGAEGEIRDFLVVRCNDRFTELTGFPTVDIEGKGLLSVFPNARTSGLFEMFCRVIEGNTPQIQQTYFAQSFQRWYDYMAVRLGENRVVVTFQEITKQREAALKIEEQKMLLDKIMEHSPSGIAVYKAIRNEDQQVTDFQSILANDAAERFTGISNEVRFTRTVLEITPELQSSPVFAMAIQSLETGQPFQTQYFLAQQGRWLELSVAKMDESHLINVFTDVTATKEVQLQLEQSVTELQRLNANLEQFAYAASHDLKEPIRKITFFTDRLKNRMARKMDAEEHHLMSRIETAARRMGALIDDLLEYSYISRGAGSVGEVNLNGIIRLVLEDLELTIQEKGAEIHIGNLPVVAGDKRQLQQLLQNLLSNALKYNKPGQPPQVSVNAQTIKGQDVPAGGPVQETDRVFHLLQVTDEGIGFEPEQADRIFNVFTRLHGNTEYKGTGVGLSIARKVAENHNGFIWAESEPEKGASFYVLLPA